jgi:hypothetical protein
VRLPSRQSVTDEKKLSFKEQRGWKRLKIIAEAERELQNKHDALLDPATISDGARLHAASLQLEAAQKAIDDLYTRWVELEQKLK